MTKPTDLSPEDDARAEAMIEALKEATKMVFAAAQTNKVAPCVACSTLAEKMIDVMIEIGHAGCVGGLVVDTLQKRANKGAVTDLSSVFGDDDDDEEERLH